MKKNLSKIVSAVLCIAMILAFTACGSGDSADEGEKTKITFCLDWTPNTNHTGLYVALANGYYDEAGLDVEIVQPPENGATTMCASGQAQFAVEAQDTFAAALDSDEPMAVTSVAAILQHNTSCIMARAGEGLDRPAGLTGKTYSTWDSPIELAMLKKVVNDDGGDFDKINLISNNITDEPAALAAKQTDAIWVFYGWGGINADVEGVDVDTWFFGDVDEALDYYTPVIIANDEFLKEYPEEAKAFLEATAKGYEYAAENPEEAAQILIDGDETGSLTGCEELVKKSQAYISGQYLNEDGKWGVIDEARWNRFYSWLYEEKLTSTDLTGKGFSNDYLPQ